MRDKATYTVTAYEEPHVCGICGPTGMRVVLVSDGAREETYRQSFCDNSDPLTPTCALEIFLYAVEKQS